MKAPSRPDGERVWLAFAQSAIAGAMSINVERDPHGQTWEEINGAIADDAAAMADAMLERWRLRYGDERPSDAPTCRPVGEPPPPAREPKEPVRW